MDGLFGEISRVRYQRRSDCPGHDHLGAVTPLGVGVAGTTLGALLERAEATLGDGAVLDLSRDVVVRLTCPSCGDAEACGAVLGTVRESRAACARCGTHRIVESTCSVSRDGIVDLSATPAQLGIPELDIIVARRGVEHHQAWLFDGDVSAVFGPLADSFRGNR